MDSNYETIFVISESDLTILKFDKFLKILNKAAITLLSEFFVSELALLLENAAFVILSAIIAILAIEDGLDLLDPAGHAHVLVEDLKTLHNP